MQRTSKKILHLCIIISIIIAIIFTAYMLVLNYGEKGETNLPFNLSKISIISTIDAQDVESNSEKWNKIVNINNDIYICIEKNKNYDKTETIKNIKLKNIKVENNPQKGEVAIYKPAHSETSIFKNIDEYKITELEVTGDLSTNIQELKISNQGGKLAFRCAQNNVGIYNSNKDKEIDYNDLLKKININYEEIKMTVSFDIEIELSSGKVFGASTRVELPMEDIIEKGTTGKEITDFSDIVFKRLEN